MRLSLRAELGLMKRDFPRLTVPVLSAARHPSESGVTFTPAYRKARRAKSGAREEVRKDGERITVWMGKPMMKRLTAAKCALSFATMKATVLFLLDVALLEIEKAAPAADTTETAPKKNDTDIITPDGENVKQKGK